MRTGFCSCFSATHAFRAILVLYFRLYTLSRSRQVVRAIFERRRDSSGVQERAHRRRTEIVPMLSSLVLVPFLTAREIVREIRQSPRSALSIWQPVDCFNSQRKRNKFTSHMNNSDSIHNACCSFICIICSIQSNDLMIQCLITFYSLQLRNLTII